MRLNSIHGHHTNKKVRNCYAKAVVDDVTLSNPSVNPYPNGFDSNRYWIRQHEIIAEPQDQQPLLIHQRGCSRKREQRLFEDTSVKDNDVPIVVHQAGWKYGWTRDFSSGDNNVEKNLSASAKFNSFYKCEWKSKPAKRCELRCDIMDMISDMDDY